MKNQESAIKPITIQQAHDRLGHMSEQATKATTCALKIPIKNGAFKPCAACAAGKAKQKCIKRIVTTKQKLGQRRAFLDIATVRKEKGMPIPSRPNWRILVVDQEIQLKFSKFFRHKNDMVQPTCEQLNKWHQAKLGVTHLRMDNAGENKLLQQNIEGKDWKLPIITEYTARDTPQQNSIAEVGFATIANRGRSMMHRANLPMALRYIISHEAFNCATQLDGLVSVTINGVTKSRYEHWVGKNPAFSKYLRTWGEAGKVKIKTKTSTKLKDKGVHCMFVGYTTEHSGDTFRMYDRKTNCVWVSRDVIWLKQMYFEQPPTAREMTIEPIMFDVVREGEQQPLPEEMDKDGDATEESEEIEAQSQEDGEGESVCDDTNDPLDQHDNNTTNTPAANNNTTITTSGRTVNRPAWMDEYEMGLTAAELKYYEAMKLLSSTDIELGLVGAGLGDGITNTKELHVMGYDEAMNQDDRVEWEKSIEDEHGCTKTNDVWEPVPHSEVPDDADIIDSTWAMKKKASGVYRDRLAVRGFKQRPGVSFDLKKVFAPVVHDITVRIVFVLLLTALWHSEIIDVKGAFPKGWFGPNEKVFMEVPKGFQRYYPGDVAIKTYTVWGSECSEGILACVIDVIGNLQHTAKQS